MESLCRSELFLILFLTDILADNELYMWGSNKYGQLGLGDTQDRNIPQYTGLTIDAISVGSEHNLVLKSNSIHVFGWSEHGQLGLNDELDRCLPRVIPNLQVDNVFTGYGFSFALSNSF